MNSFTEPSQGDVSLLSSTHDGEDAENELVAASVGPLQVASSLSTVDETAVASAPEGAMMASTSESRPRSEIAFARTPSNRLQNKKRRVDEYQCLISEEREKIQLENYKLQLEVKKLEIEVNKLETEINKLDTEVKKLDMERKLVELQFYKETLIVRKLESEMGAPHIVSASG